MGVMLFGHAFQKHGLARRIALVALSIPGVGPLRRRIDIRNHGRIRGVVRGAE